MDIQWAKASPPPKESGYYFVEYYNPELKGVFYKAICYCTHQQKWIAWRKGVEGLEVYRYVPASRNDYYVPCMQWYEEGMGQ